MRVAAVVWIVVLGGFPGGCSLSLFDEPLGEDAAGGDDGGADADARPDGDADAGADADADADAEAEVGPDCGNGDVDDGEDCDDGNDDDTDGCRNDCTFTCTSATDCDDGEICNGTELCNTRQHRCYPGSPATDGTTCDLGGSPGSCRAGLCASASCGDNVRDAGEECDDGNLENTDACTADCRNARCGDGYVRTGVEQCDTTGRECLFSSGACSAPGFQPCGSSCTWGTCAATATEVCDALDNNCDGRTDETFACVRGAAVSCTTGCGSTGSGTCSPACGLPTAAECAPPAEIACNGADDDCDGKVDEDMWCRTAVGAANPFFDIDVGPSIGWAVGARGKMARFDPGTGVWSDYSAGMTWDIHTVVRGNDDRNFWAAGTEGRLIRWDGTSWRNHSPTPTTYTLRSLLAMDANWIYAVGDGGVVVRWNGASWLTERGGTAAGSALYGVASAGGSYTFAVGDVGTMLQRDAAGAWNSITAVTTRTLRDARTLGAWNQIWAVGEDSTIVRYNGTAWTVITGIPTSTLPPGVSLNGIDGSAEDFWIVGSSGTVVRALGPDGSRSWRALGTGASQTLTAVKVTSAGVWAVDNAGGIWRRAP